jgi:peptidoglycan/LPS O-acetylase OafA/YrhL
MKNLYRPEIDGLRGIAVLSVVFYHFKFEVFGKELFQGGFLGVDVFFVISGYLITKILLNSLQNINDFSFLIFI